MRIKPIGALRGNEILAESIMTPEKMIMIPKGTLLKEDYIPLIQSLGIENVMIEDPYENYEEPAIFINRGKLDKITNHVQKVMENHIYHTEKSMWGMEIIANEIMEEFDKMSENEVVDMSERRANLYEHTVMVTLLSISIARKMNLDKQKQYNIAVGCLLHDIGLRYITTSFANWNGDDPMEVFEFKKHTLLGYSALDEEKWIPDISRKMVLFHHERQDGAGFPMHQKNREIECKIIQVCDAFDCYISGMECRRMSVQEALNKIKEESGTAFDSKIVDILISKIAYYPVGTTVKMNNQTEGVVVSQTVDSNSPVIMVLSPDAHNQKNNLMLEKDISILKII
jgi:putative nucleotidyltransferase with HDIG domain